MEDKNKKMGGVLSAPPNPPRFPPFDTRWQKPVARNQESPQVSQGGVLV